MDRQELLEEVQRAATQRVLFLPHAIRQMARPDRVITPSEIGTVVMQGEVIEDYPEDVRGHSCLVHGYGVGQRDIHVVGRQRSIFWRSSRPIFLRKNNGRRTYGQGGKYELRPVSWTNETIQRPFSFRPQRLSLNVR